MLKLPAKLDNLREFIAYIRKLALDNNIKEDIVMNIELACEEALVNIIKYAYPDKEGDIEVLCDLIDKNFIIEICDKGRPFDSGKKEDPDVTASLEEREIGGLGIYLIKQLMDEVDYKREDGKNILILKIKTNSKIQKHK